MQIIKLTFLKAGPKDWMLTPVHNGRWTSRKLRVDVKHINMADHPKFKQIKSDPLIIQKFDGRRQCVHVRRGVCERCEFKLLP